MTGEHVLVRKPGGRWEPPGVDSYENERELQQLVADSPQLVASTEAVVALREFSLPAAGTLDVLIIDLDGHLTLVEAKLNRNPDIRRAVVGQLLGYAGALWGMGYDELDAAVARRKAATLVELAVAKAEGADFEAEEFRARVASNLRAGAFRLVFAVDEITEDLRRAVEYLNAHTVDALEVLVLEFGYSKVGDLEILLPNTFGEETVRRKHARRGAQSWNEAAFFEALHAQASEEEVRLVRRVYEWATPRVSSFTGGEGHRPACNFVFEVPEGTIQPCRVVLTSNGLLVRVNFELARKRPRLALEAMLEHLSALPAFAAMRREILEADFHKRPALPVAEFGDGGITALIEALEALLEHPAAN
jgi:hypothetical protein